MNNINVFELYGKSEHYLFNIISLNEDTKGGQDISADVHNSTRVDVIQYMLLYLSVCSCYH